MPSFLSKVFSRKNSKDGDSDPVTGGGGDDVAGSGPKSPTSPNHHKSNPSLLEGKFEAVITPASPLSSNFAEANTNNIQLQKQEKDSGLGGFTLFKAKSRTPTTPLSPTKRIGELPALSLNYENGTPTSTSSPFSPFSPTSPASPTSIPSPSAARVLGVVFEGDDRHLLDERLIGATRLSPAEALVLIKACSLVIAERGLETLGIMHPHWYSASPEIQRRLISLFIQSLPIVSTSDEAQTPAQTAFETELKSTRSPHDVAAVLRWGLRHLKLEGGSFGLPSPLESEWSWYTTFFLAERTPPQPYQLDAYTAHLPPLLPHAHFALLTATLEILSSLAAHAEGNGMGGSKLCRGLGWWVCCGGRNGVEQPESERVGRAEDAGGVVVRKDTIEGWEEFYMQWEMAGRVLEHLFLARIRDEVMNHRMPTRLMELVKHYPFKKEPSTTDSDTKDKAEGEELVLARPRFSTRTFDALFVRIETELPHSSTDTSSSPLSPKASKSRITIATINKPHPKPKGGYLRLLAEAFNVDLIKEIESGEGNKGEGDGVDTYYMDVWENIRKAALLEDAENTTGPEAQATEVTKSKKVPVLNRVFTDETIRLLSLLPHAAGGNGNDVGVELISGGLGVGVNSRVGRTVTSSGHTRRRSSSLSNIPDYQGSNGTSPVNGDGHDITSPSKAAGVPLPPSPGVDWAQFTTAGFGAGTSEEEAGRHLFLTGLLDHEDVEVTKPPAVPLSSGSSTFPVVPLSFPSPFSIARKVSRGKRDSSRRSSADSPNPSTSSIPDAEAEVVVGKSKATRVKHIQLDEAFVDFWSDAVLDPISASWPTFVVCKLNPGVGVAVGANEGQQTEINWLVVEQTYSTPPVPRMASLSREGSGKRGSSPKPSLRSDLSRMSSTFTASTRKRFSFFGGSGGVASGKVEKAKAKGVGRKSSVKGVRVGEMGEVLPDVLEKPEGTGGGVPAAAAAPIILAAAATEAVESTKAGSGDKDAGDISSAKAEEPTATAAVATNGAVADREVLKDPIAHPVTTDDTARETQKVEEDTPPPGPEQVFPSGNTPNPQVALNTSEVVAITSEPTPPVETADAVETSAPVPVEDIPGPQVTSDTEPGAAEPLKVHDEPAPVLPTAGEEAVAPIPIVMDEDASSTPEPEPEPISEPLVDASLSYHETEAPAVANDITNLVVEPEAADEPPAPPVESIEAVVSEPVREVTPASIVEPQSISPVDADIEPETTSPAVTAEHRPAAPDVPLEESHEAVEPTFEPEVFPEEITPHAADEAPTEPHSQSEPTPSEVSHEDISPHQGKEASAEALSEPEPPAPEVLHEEITFDEAGEASTLPVFEPEPPASEAPHEEVASDEPAETVAQTIPEPGPSMPEAAHHETLAQAVPEPAEPEDSHDEAASVAANENLARDEVTFGEAEAPTQAISELEPATPEALLSTEAPELVPSLSVEESCVTELATAEAVEAAPPQNLELSAEPILDPQEHEQFSTKPPTEHEVEDIPSNDSQHAETASEPCIAEETS